MNRAIFIDISGIGNFNTVKEAVMMANEVLRNDRFYERISRHLSFDHANISPATVARLMKESAFSMSVDLYYALSPIQNIDGFDDKDNPFVIHMNVWKIDRSPESMCNTLIHACVHAVNAYYDEYDFGHGDDTYAGKENTAPYWIGALAQEMASSEETIIIPLEHDTHPQNIYMSKQFANTQFMMAK